MAHAIIDRRKNDKGKSSVNRRKFIQRVRGQLKDSIKESIRDLDLKDLAGPGKKKVKIPFRNLDEPHFHHDGTGINDMVRPGNDKFVPGDRINRPQGGEGAGRKGSPDGESVDDFKFHLTKEEFLDLFFENCELPDLMKKSFALLNEEELRRQGFTSDGPPAAMSIIRSMRKAKARRFGLRALKQKKLRRLEGEREELIAHITKMLTNGEDVTEERAKLVELDKEIESLKKRLENIPFLDPMDLQYHHWEKIQLPSVQAVVFLVMDVSGSMTELLKELAKSFFLLMYLFLERSYERVEIVYVKYHSIAKITDAEDFYYGQETGGTVASSALQLVYDTITEKYPTSMWNAYVAHASDGDNFGHDNLEVINIITQKLLPLLQYYAYVQINAEEIQAWWNSLDDEDNLWQVFKKLKEDHRNLDAALVENAKDVYPVFLKLFEKRKK